MVHRFGDTLPIIGAWAQMASEYYSMLTASSIQARGKKTG